VQRPRIGYPEAIFDGVDPATCTRLNLDTLIENAWDSGHAVTEAYGQSWPPLRVDGQAGEA
jgi:hypothetical protein